MNFPDMARFQQQLVSSPVADAAAQTRAALESIDSASFELSGKTVAVAAGSRRIDRIDTVVREVIGFLRERGARPFIVPAMGSHGGATAEGQKALLAGYGITESAMGAPVRPEMETAAAGQTPEGLPLHIASAALAADHIVPVNRIKPHTKFCADIESGLCKMLVIGLGKEKGAAACHRFAVRHSFSVIESAAAVLLDRLSVLFGLGVIEDGGGRLAEIHALPPESLIEGEKALLKNAYAIMGRIPFDRIDILVVDRIGKEISGIGMDSNVTGRHRDITGDFSLPPRPARIFVRELTAASDGNANGIGLADITTNRLVSRIDVEKTTINAVAAVSPEKAAIPIHFETDRRCLEVCLHLAGIERGEDARIVRIRDTASLKFMEVSTSLENETGPDGRLARIGPWSPWAFDREGNLLPFYPED